MKKLKNMKTGNKKNKGRKQVSQPRQAARSTPEVAARSGAPGKSQAKIVSGSTKTSKGKTAEPVIVKNRLSAKHRDEFRKLLLRMRDRLSGQMASLKNESLESNDWLNVEEDGTDVFDQQFALDIVSSENEMLLQIDDALDRIGKQTYGVCEECGGLINEHRLKALPFVRTCIGCQSQRETRGAVRVRPSERLEEL